MPLKLDAAAVRRLCSPDQFTFQTTADLPVLDSILGQPRAMRALEMGSAIASHGFNLFAVGQPGSGKTTLVRQFLERRATTLPVPDDLCYVNNFADNRKPLPLRLPAGRAVQLRKDVAALVEELKAAIPRAFESEEYSQQRDIVVRQLEEQRREAASRLDQRVAEAGFQLLKGPGALILAPLVGGKLLTDKDLEGLTPEEKSKIDRVRGKLQSEIEERLRQIRQMEKGARDALQALDTETASFATRHLVDDLRSRYQDLPGVLSFLDALQADVVAHADDFRKGKEGDTPQVLPLPAPVDGERAFARYQVNVLVDNSALQGAPVVVESNPTYHNLTGRIEHQSFWGGLITDHTMIKAGALHRAHGGYLIVPARECLMSPYAWEGLKRALKDRALDVEELGTQLSLMSTVTLDPEPVPLDVKVVLLGGGFLHMLLSFYDEDFAKLFKVKADFATRMERTADSEHAYALFIASLTQQEKLSPLDRAAVARVVEFGSRAAGDQTHLSTRFGEIADLVRESAHGADGVVTVENVRAAEQARRYRENLIEERIQEEIARGTILIDTAGTAVGRLNGLSVLSLGELSFGHPVRLSGTVAPGRRGIVSIEREVELSGPIHGKGVLILSGYLLRQYGTRGPLGLSASLVFEQSYGMVEGDSASLGELCVLLSALSEIPLRQDVAVTGSVNQHGTVQAVGGVTDKVEGFFDVCAARGLSGTQGVLLPASNQRHLMLRDDVVAAVADGRFHIWTTESVDDALAFLTGREAAEVHAAAAARLGEFEKALKESTGDKDPQPQGATGVQ